jgi:hypothetical protein
MALTKLPSQETLRNRFDYDAATGQLVWRHSDTAPWWWNGKHAGKPAGSQDGQGYIAIGLDGKVYRAHRLIWVFFHGQYDDSLQIDHINQDRADNRIENLRLATPAQNRQNAKRREDNKSGARGVDYQSRFGKWRARITVNGKTHALGNYDTLEEASRAYAAASRKLHGDFSSLGCEQ